MIDRSFSQFPQCPVDPSGQKFPLWHFQMSCQGFPRETIPFMGYSVRRWVLAVVHVRVRVCADTITVVAPSTRSNHYLIRPSANAQTMYVPRSLVLDSVMYVRTLAVTSGATRSGGASTARPGHKTAQLIGKVNHWVLSCTCVVLVHHRLVYSRTSVCVCGCVCVGGLGGWMAVCGWWVDWSPGRVSRTLTPSCVCWSSCCGVVNDQTNGIVRCAQVRPPWVRIAGTSDAGL